MLSALLVMCVALWISNSDFLSASNVVNTTRQVSMLGIFSIGIAFVIITGGIDLSIGSVVGLTGVVIARLSSTQAGGLGYPLWIGIGAGLSAALAVGVLQGLLITRLKLQPFIVTLGGMLLIRGVSQTLVDGGVISLGDSSLLNLASGGLVHLGREALIGWPLVIFGAVATLGAYVLHYTVLGRYIYAIGGNREAARYSGIDVNRVELLTYVISSGTAGIAGICYAAYIGQMSQQVGISYELYAIAAAVLGGCSLRGGEGTIFGVLLGAAVMRVIDNGINMFQVQYADPDGIRRTWRLNQNWNWIIVGAVILVAVVLDQVVHLVQAARRLKEASPRDRIATSPVPTKSTAA
ncbi:MAG TPA: ABC transporter permease [Polyangiaceae bacterium]|nr:ABC transporter permease [Polyangiaceae bacterium]